MLSQIVIKSFCNYILVLLVFESSELSLEMNNITLFASKMCPYARKASIALRQKTNEYTAVDEDLLNKSQSLKNAYSKAVGSTPGRDGAVPVLVDNGVSLTESQPVVWYIAEKFQNEGNNLIPQDHVERFKMRLFIEEFSKKLGPLLSKFFAWGKKSEEQKTKQVQQANEFLEKLDNRLVLPYALGEQFTVADVLIYSHFEVWGGLEHYTSSGIDKKYEKVHQYISEVQKRKSVKDLIQPKEAYAEALKKFF